MEGANIPVIEQQPALCYPVAGVSSDGHVVARSAAMRDVLAQASRIANTSIPVLLQGEIGVGKKTLARDIHRHSPSNTGPFVPVPCEAFVESGLCERLFAESGGLLRADASRPATFSESARHGTLYLDGITHLPLWAQVKLLGALQSSNSRNGDNGATLPAQARVIASSTCDLEAAVAENRFYPGLYYYLNAVRIDVPPLRHRQEDILALAEHFLAAAVSVLPPSRNQLPWRFSEEARRALLQYDWPGNVLQLAAVVAHAATLAEGPEIGQTSVAGLTGEVRQQTDCETISVPLAGGLKEMESILINEVIRRCRGNKAAAARALKLHRRTLYRLLEE